jgi:D-glycero-alpha-D-manno-heptose 1-phosphate guanylyltransferase
MVNEAIILAGGKGSRLKGVISDRAKPMAIVNGKPFLEHLLKKLEDNGIRKVVLAVGYKYESIVDYFGWRFGKIKLVYTLEETPLGTGGGIVLGLPETKNPNVLIINGDTFFDLDLKLMINHHLKLKCDVTMALKDMPTPDRYGTVSTDDLNDMAWLKRERDERAIRKTERIRDEELEAVRKEEIKEYDEWLSQKTLGDVLEREEPDEENADDKSKDDKDKDQAARQDDEGEKKRIDLTALRLDAVDATKVVRFKEKQKGLKRGFINAGVYIIKKKLLYDKKMGDEFSFERDFLERSVGKIFISGFISDAYFVDIGIPEDYAKANEDFKNR